MKNKINSKKTLKIALIEFLVFIIAFASIWGYYLILENNISNHKDAARRAGYTEYFEGTIEEYEYISLQDNDYIALSIYHYGWFGTCDSESYLIDTDSPSIKKYDEGDNVVIFYKDMEADPSDHYNDINKYPITEIHSMCKGTSNYSDFLLVALFLGIPGAAIIVIITLLVALIFLIIERNKKKKEMLPIDNTSQDTQDYQNYL